MTTLPRSSEACICVRGRSQNERSLGGVQAMVQHGVSFAFGQTVFADVMKAPCMYTFNYLNACV